jgi:hypothetical protein
MAISSSEDEYQPRACQRKAPRKGLQQSSSSSSSVSSQDLSSLNEAVTQGFTVLQCLAQGMDAPVTKAMMQEAKAVADSTKRNSSSALR